MEVPLYPTLVNTIVKRYCKASYIIKIYTLVNAARGLSPFVMVAFKEEDMALMQQDHKDLLNMSLVSTYEVKATPTKLILSTPTDSEGFMMMLNIFAKLIVALFSSP